MQMERQHGGRLVDKPKHMLYQYGLGSLCLTVDDLCVGWRCKLNTNCQVLVGMIIPFQMANFDLFCELEVIAMLKACACKIVSCV